MLQRLKEFLFKNQTARQTVAKNAVWLTISNFGGRLIKAAVVIYGARVLGTSEYGLFSYAVTLAGFFTLFVDPGINAILMRDASKASEEKRAAIFSTTLVLKVILLAIGISIILFIAPLFSTLPGAQALLPFAALIIFFDTLREFLSSLIRAMEKMEWETGIFLATNLAILVFGFIFLLHSPSAKNFALGYVVGSGIGALIAIVAFFDYIKKSLSYFSKQLIVPILQSAWPFAVTGALGLLLTNMDILIISWLRTAADVGVYSAGIRIIQLLYLIPMVIQFSTLPLFSRLAKKDDPKFRRALERILGIIFISSIPLALGGAVLGTQILRLVFGQAYTSGGLAFKILVLTMIVDYPAAIISNAIFAYDHQKSLIVSSAIGGTANVVFDLLLIPRFGIVGSSVATLCAQILSNAYLWRAMKKINYFSIVPRLIRIAFAGIIMAIGNLIMLQSGVNIILNMTVSVAFYFILLKIFKEPLLAEIRYIFTPEAVTPETVTL